MARIPGVPHWKADLRQAQQLTETVALDAAQLAGMPRPRPGQEIPALLYSIQSAFHVVAEAMANQERQIAALRPQPESTPKSAVQAIAEAALTLAELRERLREITTSADGRSLSPEPGRLGWVIERLDEALGQLDVVEFQDEGLVDLARNHVVDRLPASSAHPAGTIASSPRPGLLVHGEVLRPQQVVIYVDEHDAV
jgi:molecular chaperone GrpE (heat shock protein)